ncbi:MAG: hypothetical protein NVV72_12830 [Asticcacaulis sp.]|nr:hypothetical protein [Asticcacaulis sp.]
MEQKGNGITMSEIGKIYQEHYFKEFERKNSIETSISIPIGILIALTGALVTIISKTTSDNIFTSIFFISFSCISFIALIVSGLLIYRANFSYDNKHLTFLINVSSYRTSIFNDSINYGKSIEDANKEADSKTLEYIYSEYAICASHNAENNDKKSMDLYRAKNSLLLSLIFVSFTSAPYICTKLLPFALMIQGKIL